MTSRDRARAWEVKEIVIDWESIWQRNSKTTEQKCATCEKRARCKHGVTAPGPCLDCYADAERRRDARPTAIIRRTNKKAKVRK